MIIASYSRYSSELQSDNSISDQERNCRQWAERHSLTITLTYADRAISGARVDRPEYQRLLADAESKKFQILVVDDLSRLSRKNTDMLRTLERLQFIGVRIIGVSDGYDSNQRGHKIQSGLRGMINEIYLDDLREKTHRGLTGKALQQKSAGGRSYGYRSQAIEDPERIDEYGRPLVIASQKIIDPEQAKIVIKIFELFAAGRSPLSIARALNDEGIPGPRSTWSRSTIYGDKRGGIGILNNPLYIGKYIWNRSKWVKDPESGKRLRRERPRNDWITHDLPELRIVTQELWERVQTKLNARRNQSIAQALTGKRSGGGRYPKFLFSGLLSCAECGCKYIIMNKSHYGCAGHKERGGSICGNDIRVKRAVLEARLLDGIKSELLGNHAFDFVRREVTRLITEHNKGIQSNTQQNNLTEIEQEIANLVDAIRAGGAKTSPALLTALENAEKEYEKLRISSARAADCSEIPVFVSNLKQIFDKRVQELDKTLTQDIPAARAALIQLLGEKITLHPNKSEKYLTAEIGMNAEGMLAAGGDTGSKLMVVAGVGFEPTTFGL